MTVLGVLAHCGFYFEQVNGSCQSSTNISLKMITEVKYIVWNHKKSTTRIYVGQLSVLRFSSNRAENPKWKISNVYDKGDASGPILFLRSSPIKITPIALVITDSRSIPYSAAL